MQKESVKSFVNLLESLVFEASTAIDIVKSNPDAKALMQFLHKNAHLPHDLVYRLEDKIEWSYVKGKSWRDKGRRWIIVKGTKGVGAIMAQEGSYQTFAMVDNMPQQQASDSSKTIMTWLTERIGKPKVYYIATDQKTALDKHRERDQRKPIPITTYTGEENFVRLMLQKFKPLMIKSLEYALNDTKGWAQILIKNHSWAKAQEKIKYMQYLQNALDNIIENRKINFEESMFSLIAKSMHNAILLTAHHYYPDMSGGFGERSRYGNDRARLISDKAVSTLFSDIMNGDTKKLSTLISFFKGELISG